MKISAIITTYNSESVIRRTIESIRSQQREEIDFDIEIIVIDDCSSDATMEIVKSYADVILLQNETNSGGPNRGRNIGLKKSSGDYICIVDHDDEWLPFKIATQLKYVEMAKIITSNYYQIDVLKNKKDERGNKSEQAFIFHSQNKTFLNKLSKSKKGEMAYIGSILFHKSLKSILFEEEFGMIDYDWVLRLFKDNSSAEIAKALYNRHFDGTNLSLNETYRKNNYLISLKTISLYEKEYPEFVTKSIKRINGSMARYYYLMGNMPLARSFFCKSERDMKIFLYYLTTFAGSSFVKKYFNVFG